VPCRVNAFTPPYPLNAPRIAGLVWDLTCLATSLCQLGGIDIENNMSAYTALALRMLDRELQAPVAGSHAPHQLALRLAQLILQNIDRATLCCRWSGR
jgi:hypothetical protein